MVMATKNYYMEAPFCWQDGLSHYCFSIFISSSSQSQLHPPLSLLSSPFLSVHSALLSPDRLMNDSKEMYAFGEGERVNMEGRPKDNTIKNQRETKLKVKRTNAII